MIFIETSKFTKILSYCLSDDEYRMLQWHLQEKPDSGDIVRGSGGVRKVRWAPEGKGKSVGVRVIITGKRVTMKYECSQCTVSLNKPLYPATYLERLRRLS